MSSDIQHGNYEITRGKDFWRVDYFRMWDKNGPELYISRIVRDNKFLDSRTIEERIASAIGEVSREVKQRHEDWLNLKDQKVALQGLLSSLDLYDF